MAAANSKGHPGLILPSSTSEFQSVVEALTGHHIAMHGQLVNIAAYLRGVLPDVIAARGGTRAAFLGLDAKLSARQVVKPLMDAAALNEVQARLYSQAYQRYLERVVNIAPNASNRPKFDAER